jgi:hypothetical protein
MSRINLKDKTPIRREKRDLAPEKPPGAYAALPDSVTDSPNYISLSDAAVRLLVELVRHHDGWNNGLLHTAYTALRKRGLGSQSKVQKAFDELVNAGFIVKTRNGGLNTGPDMYALTWLPPSRTDRAGNQKDMPLLPKTYPINSFLNVPFPIRQKSLRGAARRSMTAKIARELAGDEAPGKFSPQEHES